jgi:hypothetical protein
MINVEAICSPKEGWIDTEEQAVLRKALVDILDGRNPIDQIVIGRDLIDLMRDQLMRLTSEMRKAAAQCAKDELGMSPAEIVSESGLSGPTVSRLLTRHRVRAEVEEDVPA